MRHSVTSKIHSVNNSLLSVPFFSGHSWEPYLWLWNLNVEKKLKCNEQSQWGCARKYRERKVTSLAQSKAKFNLVRNHIYFGIMQPINFLYGGDFSCYSSQTYLTVFGIDYCLSDHQLFLWNLRTVTFYLLNNLNLGEHRVTFIIALIQFWSTESALAL